LAPIPAEAGSHLEGAPGVGARVPWWVVGAVRAEKRVVTKRFGGLVRQPHVSDEDLKISFAGFYFASKDRCLRAAVGAGIAPERADDAVAEAFSRAWANWPTVRGKASPAAWVVRTAVNTDISWWRRKRRELLSDQPPAEIGAAEVDDWDVDLLAAIRRLPPRQREVVVLRYLLDLDSNAVARELGIARGTVSAQLHHAIASLRAQLHEIPTEGASR
jgi:RNA polymerase sigma factor (sigma-70 family)